MRRDDMAGLTGGCGGAGGSHGDRHPGARGRPHLDRRLVRRPAAVLRAAGADVPPPVYVAPPPRPISYAPAAYPVWYGHPGRHLGHYKHGWKHHGWKHGHDDWD